MAYVTSVPAAAKCHFKGFVTVYQIIGSVMHKCLAPVSVGQMSCL